MKLPAIFGGYRRYVQDQQRVFDDYAKRKVAEARKHWEREQLEDEYMVRHHPNSFRSRRVMRQRNRMQYLTPEGYLHLRETGELRKYEEYRGIVGPKNADVKKFEEWRAATKEEGDSS